MIAARIAGMMVLVGSPIIAIMAKGGGAIFGIWAAYRILTDQGYWPGVPIFVLGLIIAKCGAAPLFASSTSYLCWWTHAIGPIWPALGIVTAVAGLLIGALHTYAENRLDKDDPIRESLDARLREILRNQ